jgi:hypothetical protein
MLKPALVVLGMLTVAGAAGAEECREIGGTYRLVGDCRVDRHVVAGPVTVAGTSCAASVTGDTTVVTPGDHPYDTCAMYAYDCNVYDGRSEEECAAEARAMEARGECHRSTITSETFPVTQRHAADGIRLNRALGLHSIGDCRIHSRVR